MISHIKSIKEISIFFVCKKPKISFENNYLEFFSKKDENLFAYQPPVGNSGDLISESLFSRTVASQSNF
jgi:hypothetical protein